MKCEICRYSFFNKQTTNVRPMSKKNLGFLMTTLRVVMAPLVMLILIDPNDPFYRVFCTTLLCFASATDWFDGYFARKYNGVTNFGKFYDPAADKIIVLVAFVILLALERINPLLVFLFLSRDFVIGAVRQAAASENVVLMARPLGKVKAAVQMVALPFLVFGRDVLGLPTMKMATIALWVALALSLLSAFEYVSSYLKKEST